MYQNGDWVMYGIHGVCRVAGTEKQLVNRKRTEYLVLEPLSQTESKFYLPTANPTAMAKIKAVLPAQELRDLLASEEIRENVWILEENQRKQTYRDLISSGDRTALLKMVNTLYRYKAAQAAAGRKFHQCDDNFLRDAEKLLSGEVAAVMDLGDDQARSLIRERLWIH